MTHNEPHFGRVAAVVVAYNREKLLEEALRAIAGQSALPAAVIVVNNASTDDSAKVAEACLADIERAGSSTRLINLTENTGGAGGFAVGIAAALLEENIDWIWVMDDDTIPTQTTVTNALAVHREYCALSDDHLAVMGSRAVWLDGENHPMNTARQKFGVGGEELQVAKRIGTVPVRTNSFVSAFVRAERVRELGLPIADYFIWNDDFEYTARLIRGARGLFVPSSVVVHKTKAKGSSDQNPGPRFFYEVRNKIWALGKSRAFNPVENALYRAATLRRWVRTVKSNDRAELEPLLKKGIAAAREHGPRPNAAVLANCGVPDDVMQVIVKHDEINAAAHR